MPKNKTSYSEKWVKETPYIKKSTKGDHFAFCIRCRVDVDISNKGIGDVKAHAGTLKHQRNERSVNSSLEIDR